MQDIFLQPIPSQVVQVSLGIQPASLNVYQTNYGLYMDVYISGTLIIGGVLCLNLNRIVRDLYFGVVGDFMFYDTQGTSDPNYTGLGSRYDLVYLSPGDLLFGVG